MRMPQVPFRSVTAVTLALFPLALGGCGTIASLDSAARRFDTYELNAIEVARAGGGGTGGATIYIAEPVASGAIASDRIVIKPDPHRVELLPDGRWVDPAGIHVQQIIARSLSRTNRFGLVTGGTSGPMPDYTLLTDLEAFQIERLPEGSPTPLRVVIRLQATLASDVGGGILARRRFAAEAPVAHGGASSVVPAFDAAMAAILQDLVSWVAAASPGPV